MIVTQRGGAPHFIDRFLAQTDHRKPRFFAGGFGDPTLLDERVAAFSQVGPLDEVSVAWGPETRSKHAVERDGVFESPASARLPNEAKRAVVRGIFPPHRARGRAVVWLAATKPRHQHRTRRPHEFTPPRAGGGFRTRPPRPSMPRAREWCRRPSRA